MSADDFHHSAHGGAVQTASPSSDDATYEAITQSPAEQRYSEAAVIDDSTGLFQEYHDISPKYFDKVSGAELIEDMRHYKELDNELRLASNEFAEFTVLQNTVANIVPAISGEKQVDESYFELLQQVKQAITVDFPQTVVDQQTAELFWDTLGDLTLYKGSLAAALDADDDYLERTLGLAQSTRENIVDLTLRQQIEAFTALLKEYEPIIDRQVVLAQQAVESFAAKFDPAKNVED